MDKLARCCYRGGTMGDSASGGCGSREQTLLEAAKALVDLVPLGDGAWANLRAAIAREEAKKGPAAEFLDRLARTEDRAQQAEADAAWWKAEGERLSAELALAKTHMTLAIERSERLSGQLKGCECDLGQAGKLRNRAEKAEADVRVLRDALASAHSLPADTPTKDLIGKLWEGINGNAEHLSRTGHGLPLKVSKVLPLVVDELLRLRGEMTKVKAQRDDYAAAFASKVMDQDLKAALGGPQVGIVRDPVTGWTFDTFREQHDLNRAAVRVLTSELCIARNQLAKGAAR